LGVEIAAHCDYLYYKLRLFKLTYLLTYYMQTTVFYDPHGYPEMPESLLVNAA